MTPKRKQRMALIFLMVTGVAVAVGLGTYALRQNMEFFFSPTQVKAGEAPSEQNMRVGGLVVTGSVKRATDSLKIAFDITDNTETMTVNYEGILPDLFREGQGIIAKGRMDKNDVFMANEVLAKHDENYMPPEVAAALKKSGKWKPGQTGQMPESMPVSAAGSSGT